MSPQEVAEAILAGAARTQTDLRSTLDLPDAAFEALVAQSRTGAPDRGPDGALVVTPLVAEVLEALAGSWEAYAEQALDNAREHRGDYLADLEGLLEDVPAQLRLLARGTWGAGTVAPTPATPYVLHYVSQDVTMDGEPMATWSVYREQYPHRDHDEPIDGSQEHVSTWPTEDRAREEAGWLQDQSNPGS